MTWRLLIGLLLGTLPAPAADADLILHNGKVVTVDAAFHVVEAVALKDGRITATGTSAAILRAERAPKTTVVDLHGRTVLPGLIDAHVHALEAGLSEFRTPLPVLDSIGAIQEYIRAAARSRPKGAWIVVPRTLPPRLKEMRFPTKQDLDVTSDDPVAFDGSYVWGANSLALKLSGIDRNTPNPPNGEIVKGPDGEPNGILRNASQLLKGLEPSEGFSDDDKVAALGKMLQLYAAAGLTAVGDRAVTPVEVAVYQKLKSRQQLPVRVILTWRINAARPVEQIVSEIQASPWATNQGDDWLRFGTFKVTLDGGQSVGTAYQRSPYGSFGRQLYGQTDPDSRGMLFIDPEKLYRIMSTARDKGWQLTAHVQGGGAIDALLDVFERLNREKPIAPSRSHVMHGSFMSEDALNRMQRMGVLVDVQPGWLYFDVPALKRVFGLEHMRYFFPLRSYIDRGIVVAGGSDHMIGHDKNGAVNAFNPFFNMWASITRRTREGEVIYPQEKVTRQEALKMWTIWAAYLQFGEKSRGSIEPGKFADLVVIDRDYLTCPEDEIRGIGPVATIVNGNVVYGRLSL
jgi:predicted amidohydrolase YtcJ